MGEAFETDMKEGHVSIPGSSLPGTENHVSFLVTSYDTQDKYVSATIPPLSLQLTFLEVNSEFLAVAGICEMITVTLCLG